MWLTQRLPIIRSGMNLAKNVDKIIENLEQLKKMLVLLSEERKVVLSHHKTFEHVEKMRKIVNESIDMANQ